jgi:hypothetical protein
MIACAIAVPSKLLSASIAASSRSHTDRARAAPSRFTISDEALLGVLDVNSGDDQWSYYSEEMTEDGELKYAMVSQCSVRGGRLSRMDETVERQELRR